jgi:hypothetical protein
LGGALAVTALLALASPAAAHVTVDVADGRFAMELGFQNEPAYVGQPNALFLRVSEYGGSGTEPVDGLAATLTATIEKDGRTLDVPLVPQEEGVYLAPFFPTAIGDYTFRVEGTIDGEAVAVEETSSPTTFNPVEALSAVQFPRPLPDATELAAQAEEAAEAAAAARTFAVIAIAIGTLGAALAALSLVRGAAARPAAPRAGGRG